MAITVTVMVTAAPTTPAPTTREAMAGMTATMVRSIAAIGGGAGSITIGCTRAIIGGGTMGGISAAAIGPTANGGAGTAMIAAITIMITMMIELAAGIGG